MLGTLNHPPHRPFRPLLLPLHDPFPARPRAIPLDLDRVSPTLPSSRFPISSIRPEAPQNCSAQPPAVPPGPRYPRYDPLHILTTPPAPTHAPPSSSLPPSRLPPAPAPSVAPGVLADGVLTALFPDVKRFLAAAAIAPPACPLLPADDRIFALAALSVFYRPLHPAHWVFWNKDQKRSTAAIVQSVLGPCLFSFLSFVFAHRVQTPSPLPSSLP